MSIRSIYKPILKPFEHENVMKLIGFSLDQFLAPELILPLMDKGDLKSYLSKETNTVSYKDAIKEWMKFSEKCLMKIIVEKNHLLV